MIIFTIFFYRRTLNKLRARLEKSKSTMEMSFIYYEKAKCYLQLGYDNLKNARNKATRCLQLAKEIKNQTWIVNALIFLVSIEFQLDNKPKCCHILYKAIAIAYKLQVPGVLIFLEKVSNIKIIIIVDSCNTNYYFKRKI